MLKKQRAQLILERLNSLYPETPVPLDHSNLYELLVAPEGFEAKSEGNPYNAYIQSIRFADADSDGDIDILLFSNGNPKVPQGSFLRNNGNMKMTYVKAGKNSRLKLTKEVAFRK